MCNKILITGGSGLLGQYLNIAASVNNKILTLFNNNKGNCSLYNCRQTDITNSEMLNEIFATFKPDIVIHTAAYTNPVFKPGQNSKEIFDLNVNSTRHLAELCDTGNTKLVYISTDLVYAGYRGSMLKEDAKLIPVSLYAETKLMGEIKIKETLGNYLILRTALLYGFGLNHSRCHFHNMFDSLNGGIPVKLFTDQYRTPIALSEAANIIVQLCTMDLKEDTINLGGSERVSRFELGEMLCNVTGFNKSLLIKSKLGDLPELPKVDDVSLNTDKLQSLGFKVKSIGQNILDIISDNSRY